MSIWFEARDEDIDIDDNDMSANILIKSDDQGNTYITLTNKQIMEMAAKASNGKILISCEPLRQVLQAINGPSHHISELQATRKLPVGEKNPIDVLIEEYNQYARK